MYAVIETGGKQYRVEVGTELEVELLDVEPGQAITLDRVLLVADGDEASIGRPLVENAVVDAEVLRMDRGEKLISFKYRPKARRRVKKGHRQELTVLRITDVRLDGKSAAEAVRQTESDAAAERQRLEEAAARQAAADAELAARLAAKSAAAAPSEDAPEAEAPARPKSSRSKTPPAGTAATEAEATDEAAAPARPKTSRAKAAKPAPEATEPESTASPTPEAEAATTSETAAEAPEGDGAEKSE
jgi:large subunit ribosomal protein L21